MTSGPLSIVRAALDAYVSKNRQAIERLIHEDYRFTSPLDNALSRTTYFERCWPNSAQITGFDFICGSEDAERAYIVYEGHTKDGKTFRNCEMHLVKDGKLAVTEVYFGWDLPHPAKAGGFVSKGGSDK